MSKLLIALAMALAFSFAMPVLADEAPAAATVEVAGEDCATGADGETLAGSCGRCGDGYCSKSCGEDAISCPKDCGEVDS